MKYNCLQKKTVLTFSLVCLFFSIKNTFSQSFYINPKLSTSMSFTSAQADIKSKDLPMNASFESPYGLIKNHDVLKAPVFPFGLGVGMYIKARHKVEVEFEKTTNSYQIQTNFYDFRNGFGWMEGRNEHKQRFHRLMLSYAYKLIDKKEKSSLWVSVAPGISFSKGIGISFLSEVNQSVALAPNVYLDNVNYKMMSNSSNNFFLRFGIESDLRINNRYLFSYGLFYTQGFGRLQTNVLSFQYTEYNYDCSASESTTFSRDVYSKGSAVQLTISRRFELKPFKKQKEIE